MANQSSDSSECSSECSSSSSESSSSLSSSSSSSWNSSQSSSSCSSSTHCQLLHEMVFVTNEGSIHTSVSHGSTNQYDDQHHTHEHIQYQSQSKTHSPSQTSSTEAELFSTWSNNHHTPLDLTSGVGTVTYSR